MKNLYFQKNLLSSTFIFMFLTIYLINPTISQAQTVVIQTESFESTIFPAPGWKLTRGNVSPNIGGNGIIQRQAPPIIPNFPVNVGVPVGGGANIMSYNSGTALNGDTTYVITKPYDFSNNSGVNPNFSFWMFRDGFSAGSADRIEVLINNTPTISGATLLTNTALTTAINRNNTLSPATVANTWNQYTYSLPAATYNGKKYYFIVRCIRAAAGIGQDMFFDLFTTSTHPSLMLPADVSMQLIQQNLAPVGVGNTNTWVVGVRCVVGGTSGCGNLNASMLIPPAKLDSLLFNTNGTTNVNDIQNAKIWYTGGSAIFSTGYISPFPTVGLPAGTSYPRPNFGATIPVIATNMDFVTPGAGPCFYLEYDTTYFWLTYDVKPTATNGNSLDADFRRANVGGTGCPVALAGTGFQTVPLVSTLPGAPIIDLPYCVPTMISGTSQNGYVNNDYIYSTFLIGSYGSLINTGVQTVALQDPTAPGYPNNHFVMHPPDYELMANVPGRTVILTQGGTYSITVGCGTWFSNNVVAAWIDFNRSGTFDPGEKLGETALAALGTTTWTFTVPASGYTGPTRMRVREVFANSGINPCQTYTYGETEDYNITIAPNCNPAYKLWLGNNDNWNDPANWCGSVPTINDDVVINKSLVNPLYPYFNPTLKSGVNGNCKNISIASGDTLVVDAPNAGSLRIKGNLTIDGGFKIVSGYNSEVTYSSGTLVSNIVTPFKAQSAEARMQMIYTPAELLAQNLVAGDRITALKFNITTKGSTNAYNGFTIAYGLTATSGFATTTPLATPNTVFGPAALTTTLGTYTINLTNPIIWDGVNNLVIQYCFDNASSIGATDDRLLFTQTTGRNSTLLLSTVSNLNLGCGLTYPLAGVNSNFFPSLATSRPNVSFVISRSYAKYTVRAQSQWINNNYFDAGNSRVIMDSVVAQTIGGNQPTTFHELEINKSAAAKTVSLSRNIIVNDTLALYQGQLVMNQRSIYINNSTSLKAIDRTNGALICEDNSAASRVNWNFGTLNGVHEIPFATSSYASNVTTQYIPVRINNVTGADLGYVSINTYHTVPANTPFPPGVTHITTASSASLPGVPGANNSAFTVDRYWNLTKTGTGLSPSTTLQFYFTDAERPTGAPMTIANQPKAQPWSNTLNAWQSPVATGTFAASPSTNSSTVANYNWSIGNTIPWAVALGQQPLGAIGPQISLGSITPESCPGTSDGAIIIAVSGGFGPYAYLWSNGNVTPNLNGLSTGTYTVTVTDANGNTASSAYFVPLNGQAPATPGTMTGTAFGVCNSTKAYSVPNVVGVTYTWTVPAGANIVSGQGTNAVTIHFTNSFTNGTISVIAQNICGSSNARTKTVYGRPAKPTVINGPTTFCVSDTTIFSTPTVAGTTLYTWTIPAGLTFITGQGTTLIKVIGTGAAVNGSVCVRTENSCGVTGYFCKTVSSIPAPSQITTITGTGSGVCGQTKAYSVPAQTGVTFNWTVPPNASILSGQGTKSISVAFSSSFTNGAITVFAIGVCSNSNTVSRTIYGNPNSPSTITGPVTVCSNQQNVSYSCSTVAGATSYTWTVPSGVSFSGQGTNTVVLNFNPPIGTPVIKVKAVNACGASNFRTLNLTLLTCPRIGDMSNDDFSMSPNPASDQANVYWYTEEETQVRISVTNVLGQEVIPASIHSGNGDQQQTLDLQQLTNGVYLVQLQSSDKKVSIKKLVISR